MGSKVRGVGLSCGSWWRAAGVNTTALARIAAATAMAGNTRRTRSGPRLRARREMAAENRIGGTVINLDLPDRMALAPLLARQEGCCFGL
jgi:hypothetical protein